MLSNKAIARSINFLGKLMELHNENSFRIRSYYSAYNSLRKIEKPFCDVSDEELSSLPSVGKTIIDKIRELTKTGTLKELEEYKSITPPGIQSMLGIRGIGPKKVNVIWHDMKIETIGELLYACNENRLVNYKGFGLKTQDAIRKNLEYFISAQGKFHYATVIDKAEALLESFQDLYPDADTQFCGDVGRMMPEVKGIEIITTEQEYELTALHVLEDPEDGELKYEGIPVYIEAVDPDGFGTELFLRTASDEFIEASGVTYDDYYPFEEDLLEEIGLPFIPHEFRETAKAFNLAMEGVVPELVEDKDIKGIVHNHTTYSDGLHTLEEMTKRCIDLGYEYFVVSDHSQTAFYAEGLQEERVLMQWREIDEINTKYPDFKVFKSIESDILNDGSLDYTEDILKGFDLIIASIHSNLNMDIDKATNRLIKAIENPYTRILGHPTGRLLLGRTGYPIDHKKIIDAASANNVCIEMNANPQRLDLDWTWIDYAMDKGVMISINPDAHSMDQIEFIKYGVAAARKGGLTAEMCLNSKSLAEFTLWVNQGK